jgi:hypothetical protein
MVSARFFSITLRIVGSAALGFVTFLAVTLVLVFAARDSWLAFQWRRVFGMAPLLARVSDRNWFEGEGLLPPDYPSIVVGDRVDETVFLASWSLLFAILYFFCVFRRRTHLTNR